MATFMLIWGGQLVSLLGTAMMRFALMLWAYDRTGSATTLALLGLASYILYVLLSPVAGVIIDRVERRLVMLLADLCAALMMAVMLAIYWSGRLEVGHLYAAELLIGAFEAFQMPAYAAGITMLVPKEQRVRANALRSLAGSVSQIGGPLLGGLALRAVHLDGIMIFDIISYLVSVVVLAFVTIPRPEPAAQTMRKSFRQEAAFGWNYLRTRLDLLWLLAIMWAINFTASLTYLSILPAMILARSGDDSIALATVQAAMGIGGVAGGLLLSVWGGPRKKVLTLLVSTGLSFLLGDFVMAT
ncbi:MAG TPA: MFS transporter, partial [Aggregatilineales bacterium]|nr:MFS transporter [Aggregatilineales bacterium]